jgi:hypothetical protein
MKLYIVLALVAIVGAVGIATNDFYVVRGFKTESIKVELFQTQLQGVDADGKAEVLYSPSIDRSRESAWQSQQGICYDMYVSKSKLSSDSTYYILTSTPVMCN